MHNPKYGPERKILGNPYNFTSAGRDPDPNPKYLLMRHPASTQQFEENALRGYCTVHRHPLFVEYIEAMTVILQKAYGKMMNDIDLNAVNEVKVNAIQQHLSKGESRSQHPLEYTFFERQFLYPAELVLTGWGTTIHMDYRDGSQELERKYQFCKGWSYW